MFYIIELKAKILFFNFFIRISKNLVIKTPLFPHLDFVAVCEITDATHKSLIASLFNSAFCFGTPVIALLAYFFRTYDRLLQIISILVMIQGLVRYFFTDETAAFYFGKGQFDRCQKILRKMGRVNGRGYEVLEEVQVEMTDDTDNAAKENETNNSFLIIFQSGTEILSMAIKCSLLWAMSSLLYYGLAYNISVLPGNDFINLTIGAVFDAFGSLTYPFYADHPKIGRRNAFRLLFTVGAFVTGVNVFFILEDERNKLDCVQDEGDGNKISQILQIFLWGLGRSISSAAFSVTYQYISEVFPTFLRSRAMGFCAFFANLLASFSPAVIGLRRFYSWLPNLIFTGCCVFGSILTIGLPETLGRETPVNVEEAKKMYRG